MFGKAARFLPLLCFMALAFALGVRLSGGHAEQDDVKIISGAPIDPMQGKPLPAFSLPILGSEEKLTQAHFHGKPYLLNIMASWCAPCRMEHVVLRDYAESRHIPVYAIAWKDKPEDIRAYLDKMGNIFAEVALDPHSELTIALGSKGVPETYLIDAEGRIALIYRGMLTEQVLHSRFDRTLNALRGGQQP